MSKRYIFFIGTLCNGGAERVVSILASLMAEKGMEVEVLTFYEKEPAYHIHPDVQLQSVEKLAGSTNKVINVFWLRKYFKKNAKVVISFLAPFNIVALAAKLGTKVPTIVADRNDPTKVPRNVVVRKMRDILYMFADHVVIQTQKNQSYFNNVVQKKSTVIYNPMNMGELVGSALNTKKKKKIVTAGRLMPQKNQEMMIKAFAKVYKEFPEYQLVIYGDGPSEYSLKKLAVQLEIDGKVIFPGNVKDLHDRIKEAEVFVLSSDYEGMPNALIEAMCLGLPVISTKVSGATDLIVHEKNGLLVDIGNEEQFSEALKMMLSNEEKRKIMAREAVKLADKLQPNQILKQWQEIIRRYN